MTDLNTTYAGVQLKNPIIVGASGFTSNLDLIKRLEDAGAAAIVTKTLFEEEIQLENFKFEEDAEKYNYRHPEMITVFPPVEFGGPHEHLSWVRKTKEAVDIPVIGSLNAVNRETWLEYALLLEKTGVDAIECDIYATPKDIETEGTAVEKDQIELVAALKQAVKVPLCVKLGHQYTNPLNVISRVVDAGADAVVFFNRFFEPDLDIDTGEHVFPVNFSHASDYRLPLRYVGLLEGQLNADICASTGILDGEAIIKLLLAGAQTVQVATALYRNGVEYIGEMLKEIEAWMAENGHKTIDDFRGSFSKRHSNDHWAYTRSQYAKLLMNPGKLIENVPVP